MTPWLAAFRAVLAAGHTPGFWDSADLEPPFDARVIVVPAVTTADSDAWDLPVVSLTDADCCSADAPSLEGPLDLRLGQIESPLSPSTADSDLTSVVHRGPERCAVFVINTVVRS